MVGNILIDLVIYVCAFWVFFDAASNRIGGYKTELGNHTGVSPFIWAIGSLFIIPFVVYLFRRNKLIQYAKENPVDTDKSKYGILLFIVIAALVAFSYKDSLIS
ncbi:hypothetical protein H2Y54_01700 [Pectobacterium aroidearum]|uniref:hypothetical protein n=1 Tax=Pectobacterium aroidearum TaxID=1201031 RepID=UPI0015F03173|nr:hypothetical protein [Pectobacterium aroidearum]MBA5235268.1 hypothetical protein [Pectobacterium aroidearum]